MIVSFLLLNRTLLEKKQCKHLWLFALKPKTMVLRT